MPILVPTTPPDALSLKTIREQMKLILEAACADYNADRPYLVHSEWKLKADLGKSVPLFQPPGSSVVHGWMIGTQAAPTQLDGNGDFQFVGSSIADRDITFSIWGMWDYVLKDPVTQKSSQEIAEEESLLIADYFKVNRNHLGFDSKPARLRRVGPFQIDNIDNHDTSDGNSVVVSQCSMRMLIRY